MAIKKIKELESGIQAEYLKVSGIILIKDTMKVTFLLFKDKVARDADKEPVQVIEKTFSHEAADFVKHPFGVCYDKIKLNDQFWSDSEDC